MNSKPKLSDKIQFYAFSFALISTFFALLTAQPFLFWASIVVIILAVLSFLLSTYIELLIRVKRINRYQPQPIKKDL